MNQIEEKTEKEHQETGRGEPHDREEERKAIESHVSLFLSFLLKHAELKVEESRRKGKVLK